MVSTLLKKPEKPLMCKPLQPYRSPTLYPIGLSHHQPLRLGEEELFLLPDLHNQTISKGKHTHLTLLPFPTSLW